MSAGPFGGRHFFVFKIMDKEEIGMRGWKILVAALALVVCGVASAQAIEAGANAVPFTLNNPVSREAVAFPAVAANKPALIVFFNTSCSACEAELAAAQTYLKNNKDAFKLIGIAIDAGSDATSRVIKYMEDRKLLDVTILVDPKFAVAEKYGFNFTPASVGVGKDGKVKFVLNGFSRAEASAFGDKLESLQK